MKAPIMPVFTDCQGVQLCCVTHSTPHRNQNNKLQQHGASHATSTFVSPHPSLTQINTINLPDALYYRRKPKGELGLRLSYQLCWVLCPHINIADPKSIQTFYLASTTRCGSNTCRCQAVYCCWYTRAQQSLLHHHLHSCSLC